MYGWFMVVFRSFKKRLIQTKSVEHGTTPHGGQQWALKSSIKDGSPWPVTKKILPVTILEVRDGWVRYSFGGHTSSDERLEEKIFTSIYQFVNSISQHGEKNEQHTH